MSFPINMAYQPGTNGTLTNVQYIAEFTNIINNMIPESIDDYSVNVTEMRIQTDPGESGSESLATTLSEEIERLRFSIKECKTNFDEQLSYWYQTPTSNSLVRTTNADCWTIYAKNTGFSNTILTLKTDEEDSGSFTFLKCVADVDGTPATKLSINQDGEITF